MDLTFVAPFLLFVRAFAEKETVESQLNASINCTETESQITLPNNQSKISVAQDQYYKLYFKGRFHPTKITRKGVVRYKFCSPLENRFLKSEQSCYDIFKVLITEFNTIFYVPFSDIVRCENALYTMLRAGANKTYDLPQFGKQFGLSNQTFEALLKPDSKREPRRMLDHKQKNQTTSPIPQLIDKKVEKRSKRDLSKTNSTSGSSDNNGSNKNTTTATASNNNNQNNNNSNEDNNKNNSNSNKQDVQLTKNNNIVLITDIISGSGVNESLIERLFKENRSGVHELYAFLLVTKDPAEKSRYVKELMTFARNVNQNCTNFVCTVDGLVETPSKAGDIATENPVTMATAKNSKPAATPEREISPKQEVPPDQKMKKTKV